MIDELLAELVQTIHKRFLQAEPSRPAKQGASIVESAGQVPPNTGQSESAEAPLSAHLSADNGSIVVGQAIGTPTINIYNDSVSSRDSRNPAEQSSASVRDSGMEMTAVDKMLFCHVPAGPFWMGKGTADKKAEQVLSEKPAGEYDLSYDYWLAQCPVLVEQFQQFVNDSQQQSEDKDSLKGQSNEPVVRVSWREAMAFCHWLTQHWQSKRWLPQGWRVTLPNEPEWEKAAHGGVQIPVMPLMETVATLFGSVNYPSLQANPLPQRRYPWGNELEDERLNYNSNRGRVSAPGAYPSGRSVYGCEDLSGNVWEWTRSHKADYPYPKPDTDQWRQREAEEATARRVLRGGAFDDGRRHVRAAVRYYYRPGHRGGDFGFRVCLSPFL